MALQSSWHAQIETLRDKGYVVVPRFVPIDGLRQLNEAARTQLAARAQPLEFEADLRYPGAPASRMAPGGETVRRLLDAYGRDPVFARWGTAPELREWMEAYFGERTLMSRAHHNCLMTKHPLYGSLTNWHRDIRYWSFAREDLVSVWFAVGKRKSTTARCGSCRVRTGWPSMPAGSMRQSSSAATVRTTPRSSAAPSRRGSRPATRCFSIATPCTPPAGIKAMR